MTDTAKEQQKELEILAALVKLNSAHIQIVNVRHVQLEGTHPFVIGGKHVAHAADHHNGRLGEETLRAIPCDECRKSYADNVHAMPEIDAIVAAQDGLTKEELVVFLRAFKPVAIEHGVSGLAILSGFDILKRINDSIREEGEHGAAKESV